MTAKHEITDLKVKHVVYWADGQKCEGTNATYRKNGVRMSSRYTYHQSEARVRAHLDGSQPFYHKRGPQ